MITPDYEYWIDDDHIRRTYESYLKEDPCKLPSSELVREAPILCQVCQRMDCICDIEVEHSNNWLKAIVLKGRRPGSGRFNQLIMELAMNEAKQKKNKNESI